MNKKVSIIVPVYNVSNYLPSCLDTLINQTYRNIEIILIDDNSTDNSLEICNKYKEKDPRIIVIHKENGGAASARNYGLNIYTGEYVSFVDSDDYIELNYIEKLVSMLEKYNADISVCSFFDVKNTNVKAFDYHCDVIEYDDEGFLKRFLDDWTCGLLWNKIFKSGVVKNIRMKEGHKIDDEFFTYKLIMNSKKVVLFNNPLYYYRQRMDSVMNLEKNQVLLLDDRLEYLEERYKTIKKNYENLSNIYFVDYLYTVIRNKKKFNINQNKKIKKFLNKNFFLFLKVKMPILIKIRVLLDFIL